MLIGVLGALIGNTPETLKVEYGYVENLLSSFKDFLPIPALILSNQDILNLIVGWVQTVWILLKQYFYF